MSVDLPEPFGADDAHDQVGRIQVALRQFAGDHVQPLPPARRVVGREDQCLVVVHDLVRTGDRIEMGNLFVHMVSASPSALVREFDVQEWGVLLGAVDVAVAGGPETMRRRSVIFTALCRLEVDDARDVLRPARRRDARSASRSMMPDAARMFEMTAVLEQDVQRQFERPGVLRADHARHVGESNGHGWGLPSRKTWISSG